MSSPKHTEARNRIMRKPEVVARLGVSETTLWRMRRRGDFPQPFRISAGLVGWCETDVDRWIESRRHAQTTRASHPRTANPSTS